MVRTMRMTGKNTRYGDGSKVQSATSASIYQLGFLLGLISLCSITFTTGLQCYECLSLTCESEVICESIKVWMNRSLVPKRQHIEFNPDLKCPESPINSTDWTNVSQECPRSDSVCLEAPIEVITDYNGLKDSLELENHSEMKSRGIIRGCAARRFLNQQPEDTIEVKAEMVNDTLSLAKRTVKGDSSDPYTIHEIHSHHIYIDQGTKESVRCYEDNCNNSKKPRKNFAPDAHAGRVGGVQLFLITIALLTFQSFISV